MKWMKKDNDSKYTLFSFPSFSFFLLLLPSFFPFLIPGQETQSLKNNEKQSKGMGTKFMLVQCLQQRGM